MDIVWLAAAGGVGWLIYQKSTTPETTESPKITVRRTVARPYAPYEVYASDGRYHLRHILSTEPASLNGAPKTLLGGPGGTKALVRVPISRVASHALPS
jgi:hypothetical protein